MPTTDLAKRVIGELEKLPAHEQDVLAARWLEELEDDRLWAAKFEATSDEAWARLAASVRAEIAAGDTVGLDEFLEEPLS